jgi:hypothetical protein
LPEITTFRAAVEGFGEEAMVTLPEAHGVGVQQPIARVAQHGVPAQQGVVWQQNGCTSGALVWTPGGSTQHGGTMCAVAPGHAMPGARRAAVAGPAIPMTHTAVAVRTSASGTIDRRIACVSGREAI